MVHSFWTLIYPVSLLAGDSVRDLLITTQWSSNPADLIDSVCCLGLTALPIPTSVLFFLLPHLSSQSVPSLSLLIKHWICMTAKGPHKGGMQEELWGQEQGKACVHCNRK